MFSSMDDCAPLPSATIVITAPTPMIMPSMVSAVRILLRASARRAIRNVMKMDMLSLPLRGGGCAGARYPAASSPFWSSSTSSGRRRQRRELDPGHAALLDAAVRDDLAVPERDHARPVLGDVVLVRDQQDRDAVLLVETLEDLHHLDAGPRVEVAGRLVGQHDRRVVDQRAGDRHALLLAAGQLVRVVMRAGLHPDRLQRRHGPLVARRCPPALAVVEQRQLDVLERRRPREQVEPLEHEPDLVVPHGGQLVPRQLGDVAAVEDVLPRLGRSRQPRMCMNVDLPDPEGPVTARNSPASMSSETPRSAWTLTSPTT